MDKIGGLIELWILATAAVAVIYFLLEPVACWLTYFVGRLLGFGSGE